MNSIYISKNVYKWLNSAIDPKHTQPSLRYFLMTDDQKLIATDGYRMHVYPTDKQHEPGYYEYDKDRRMLYRIPDDRVWHTPKYLIHNLGYPRIMAGIDKETPLQMYSCGREKLVPFCVEIYPKVTKRKNGKYVTDMIFRSGIVDGAKRAICLGINAMPIVQDEQGNAVQDSLDTVLILDAKYVLDAVAPEFVDAVMRYQPGVFKPAIVGFLDKAHALIRQRITLAQNTV